MNGRSSMRQACNRMLDIHARILRQEPLWGGATAAEIRGYRQAYRTLVKWGALADGTPTAFGTELLAAWTAKHTGTGDDTTTFEMNTLSLEDWHPGEPAEQWRAVRIVERYLWDGRMRLRVEILEGPETGRIVSAVGESSLRAR